MRSRAVRAQVGASQDGLASVPNDYFVTHPASICALLSVEDLPGVIWEPACGDGTMAETLAQHSRLSSRIVASDLVDRGYGFQRDFLETTMLWGGISHIVTNPPFELAGQFVQHALDLDPPGKVCMFLRLAFLEGKRRRDSLYSVRPPARVWVFSERQKLRRGGAGEYQSGLIAFAWYVWERGAPPVTQLGWL